MEYFFRESLYSLVELAILAKAYETSRAGRVENTTNSQLTSDFALEGTASHRDISFQQTLLKMKATEGKGRLVVAIFGADPVAFYWAQDGQRLALWVHPEHFGQGLESSMLKWADEHSMVNPVKPLSH